MKTVMTLALIALTAALFLMGCDEGFTGDQKTNRPPETNLSSSPQNGILNTSYRVQLFWTGFDPDGKVDYFEFIVTDDYITGSLIIDEDIYARLEALGYEWQITEAHDSTFIVSADSMPGDPEEDPSQIIYFYGNDRFLFKGQHTFFLRAVDEGGAFDPTPEWVTFTATTIAPMTEIVRPRDLGTTGGEEELPPDIFMSWVGIDSIGNGLITVPDSSRFSTLKNGDLGLDDPVNGLLYTFPDSVWSPWRGWEDPEDPLLRISGKSALIKNLVSSSEGEGQGHYLFFVQAKDEAGAITTHFEDGRNLKRLLIRSNLKPRLAITETILGFRQSNFDTFFDFTIAEDQPIELTWSGSADHYGSEITGFRFGWDIQDTSNDEEWSSWSINNTSTQAQFSSGNHTFYVETRDYSNNSTRIVYRFLVIPFTMDLDLLFLDDYDNTPTSNFGWPNGSPSSWSSFKHDNTDMKDRWDSILNEYLSYNGERDFYRTRRQAPPFELIASYKRIVWEVKDAGNKSGLFNVARFTDTYMDNAPPYDYLAAFTDRGGQLFLCGSWPVWCMLPVSNNMYQEYARSSPMAFLRFLRFSQGSAQQGVDAVQRYLPWKTFGIDSYVQPVNANPITSFAGTGADFPTKQRQFWGMVSANYIAEADTFPSGGAQLPAVLQMSDEVQQWFQDAGEQSNPYEDDEGNLYTTFGLNDVEIYNWDWFKWVYDPPLEYRTDKYVPMLSYVPANQDTRWGTSPSSYFPVTTITGQHYDETRYSTGGQAKHAIAVIGMEYPATPSVLLGMTPFYFSFEHHKLLVDHILVDIMGMTK